VKGILNIKLIFHIIGIVLFFESFFLLIDIPVSVIYGSIDFFPILFSYLITTFTGIALFLLTRQDLVKEPTIKESFLIVGLSWLLLSLFGTLPYLFSGAIPKFVDAFFESVSGFTTTGSSILKDIESLPKGILFWRSETHWIGGMGIIVLILAIFPFYNIGGTQLFTAEGSMISFEKLRPRIIETAKRLWGIYMALTVLEIIFLTLGGMNLFDSICHSFGTIATGGFSTKNDSLMGYSPYIQYVVTIFMFLSGANFALHYFFIQGDYKKVFSNEEFRVYTIIVLIATFIISIALIKNGRSIEAAFREALFQVVSIITATGFASADYLLWPTYAWVIIFALMFIGACVGSTGGGIKIVRHLIVYKNVKAYFKKLFHPNSVNPIRYNESIISSELMRSIFAFYFLYLLIFIFGSFLMTALGLDLESAMGSVITTMGGIGPGLGTVGPASNFSAVPAAGKIALTFFMIIGRLEIYSFLIIFTPFFWKI
jgi:trk system potassium uptake protein